MRLEQIQKIIQSAILKRDPLSLARIKGVLRFPERLEAYLHAYGAFSKSYLCNMFPHLHKLLGEDFELLIEEFCEKKSPHHYDLEVLLQSFGEFFSKHEKVRAYPFLLDLCSFELRESEIFHKAPPKKLDLQAFVKKLSKKPETTILHLQEHVQLLPLSYDLDAYFASKKKVQELDELESYRKTTRFLMYQSHWRAVYKMLDERELSFVKVLPRSFQDLCKILEENFGEGQDWSPLLLKMFERGILQEKESY